MQVRQRIRDRIDLDNTGSVYPGSRESDNSYSDDRVEVGYLIQQNGSQALNFIVQQFDPTNYGFFADNARTRYDLSRTATTASSRAASMPSTNSAVS